MLSEDCKLQKKCDKLFQDNSLSCSKNKIRSESIILWLSYQHMKHLYLITHVLSYKCPVITVEPVLKCTFSYFKLNNQHEHQKNKFHSSQTPITSRLCCCCHEGQDNVSVMGFFHWNKRSSGHPYGIKWKKISRTCS